MNSDRLDQLLENLKAETPPFPRGDVEARVLRIIRNQAPADPSNAWVPISWSIGLRFAAAVAVFAMGSGLIVGSAIARPSATQERLVARQALSFEVFDSGSFGVPPNLLNR